MSIRRIGLFSVLGIICLLLVSTQVRSAGSIQNGVDDLVAGRNVNMVSGIEKFTGDPYLQRQNEPSVAVSTRNPMHLLAGANDYRTVDFPDNEELPGMNQDTAAVDAWLGVFKSFDGGESWISMLLPGCAVDTLNPYNVDSPLIGYDAAADPVVRAGANGMFYYCGMVFNRGQKGLGAIFVARFQDLNNKESGDCIQYIDTHIVDFGKVSHFLDKPWMAVDIPRIGSKSLLPNGEEALDANIFVVYTSFMGDMEEDVHGKLMCAMSTDSGATWEKPAQITDAGQPYQAATIALDPKNGKPYVAWRRFAKDHSNAIMITWGQLRKQEKDEIFWIKNFKFVQPMVVAEIAPFDQPTYETMFRTNSYPTMTVDHNGIVYIAYSEKNDDNFARIKTTTYDPSMAQWTPSVTISLSESEDEPEVIGHQFMPALSYAAGKVTLIWYDQRFDFIQQVNPDYVEEHTLNDRFYPTQGIRHTIDVRAAQSDAGTNPDFSRSILVTQFPWVIYEESGQLWMKPLKLHMPGHTLFRDSTVPFMGDYIDLAPSPVMIPDGDGWKFNTDSTVDPVFHAVWTDNRDVNDSTSDYYTFVLPGQCDDENDADYLGNRNQNIYTSRISNGIIAGSPGNTKPLDEIPRSFVVLVKNTTGYVKELDLEIAGPLKDDANFVEGGIPLPGNTLPVTILPYNSYAATVLVGYQGSRYGKLYINVWDGSRLASQVILNPDDLNPEITNPDWYVGNLDVGFDDETHNPHIAAYDIVYWDYGKANPHVAAPHVAAPHVAAPHVAANPESVTPHVAAPHVAAPHVAAPHVAAPHVAALSIANPHVAASALGDDNIPATSTLTDVYVGVENHGNTTSSYSVSSLPGNVPSGIAVQLLIYKVHTSSSAGWDDDANNCIGKHEEHHELLANILNPHVAAPHVAASPPGEEGMSTSSLPELDPLLFADAKLALAPGERGIVLYRFLDFAPDDGEVFYPDTIEMDVTADTVNIIDKFPLELPKALSIDSPEKLATGDVDYPYPAQQLTASGGIPFQTQPPSYHWEFASTPPAALTNFLGLSEDGMLYPEENYPSAGDFSFEVQMTDSQGQTNTKIFYITILSSSISIAGTVTDANDEGVLGASITFSGGAGIAITDSYGDYTHYVPDGWEGTSKAYKAGYIFNPVEYSYSNLEGFVTGQDFTVYNPEDNVVVSGMVLDNQVPPAPLQGVTINFDTGQSATTNAAGYYSVLVPYNWTGTVSPSFPNYTFDPISWSPEANVTSNITGVDFVASLPDVVISGTVLDNQVPPAPLQGVAINFSTGQTATTNPSGYYSVLVPYNWTGTFSASHEDYNFTPPIYDYSEVGVTTDITDANFVVAPPVAVTGTISGTVNFNGANITTYTNEAVVLWVRDSSNNVPSLLSYTYDNTDGTYTITDLPPENYSIQVYIDDSKTPPDAGYFPGDFYGWNEGPFEVIAGQDTGPTTLSCNKLVHLTAPIDNAPPPLPSPSSSPHTVPLTFQWDEIWDVAWGNPPAGLTYNPRIYRIDETDGSLVTVFNQTVTDTSVTVALSDSAPNEHYEFVVYAKNDQTTIGQLIVNYQGLTSWDYEFTIDSNEQILINSTFEADIVGQLPQTGGANQPFQVLQYDGLPPIGSPLDDTIYVFENSLGFPSKYIRLDDGGRPDYWGSVDYQFAAISSGTVVVEATVSFNKAADTDKIFLSSTQGTAYATRLEFESSNRITAGSTQVGTYQIDIPFRARKYINVDSKTYSVVIDSELDGFNDDIVYTNIPFVQGGITQIDAVQASLVSYTNAAEVDRIAYDDIVVKLIFGLD